MPMEVIAFDFQFAAEHLGPTSQAADAWSRIQIQLAELLAETQGVTFRFGFQQ